MPGHPHHNRMLENAYYNHNSIPEGNLLLSRAHDYANSRVTQSEEGQYRFTQSEEGSSELVKNILDYYNTQDMINKGKRS